MYGIVKSRSGQLLVDWAVFYRF